MGATPRSVPGSRGITLLEVLISIGILSIGLLSALALIPAGRTYIKQAEQDDRATTLVPSAIATMESLGLFRESSLEWHRDDVSGLTDGEQPVERPAFRRNQLQRYFAGAWTVRAVEDARRAAGYWNVSDEHTAELRTWHGRDGRPTISGEIPKPNVNVRVAINGTWRTSDDGVVHEADDEVNPTVTRWRYSVSAADFPEPPDEDPDVAMRLIETSEDGTVGDIKPGPRFTSYTIEARYTDAENDEHEIPSTSIVVEPAGSRPVVGNLNPYHHYGRRRSLDRRFGDAILDLTVSPKDRTNESPEDARALPVPGIRDQVFQNKVRMIREISAPVTGQLWRFNEGFQMGPYHVDTTFANTEAQAMTSRTYTYPTPFWQNQKVDPLAVWVTAAGETTDDDGDPIVPEAPEDEDYYRFPVEAGVGLRVTLDTTPSGAVLKQSGIVDQDDRIQFSRTEAGPWTSLLPYATDQFAVPNDGWVRAGVRLAPFMNNTVEYVTSDNVNFTPKNHEYTLNFHLVRQDRMVAIDPLMCTHLDRIIRGDPGNHPLALRRRRFADFQQFFMGAPNSPRAFVIPRLNWRVIAENANFDTAVAVAERLCRAEDSLSVGEPATEDAPPEPEFATVGVGNGQVAPVQRQAAGRMTWMMTVQPEDPGSVAANWYAGRYFDVSIVIFEDRPIPANDQSLTTFNGEYAFAAAWGQLDGLLRISITPNGPAAALPNEEDVRRLIAPGRWLLLAPTVAVTSSPIDSRLKLEWVKIRTVSLEQDQAGFTATVLLDKEPDDDVLVKEIDGVNRAAPNDPLARLSMVALVYDGVVSVIRRSMMVQP